MNAPDTLKLDLADPNPKEVLALVETFEAAMRANPDLGDLPVTTGWNEITPEIAINLLLRNPPGANRKVVAGTVFYYAHQMARGDWKATGQPILVNKLGVLLDAQHRLYAGVISGTTFKSYVVTDVDADADMFAYIDNGRVRTAATALQTMGLNGQSPTIARVIKVAEEVRLGVYNPSFGVSKLPRLSPAEVIRLAPNYPNALKAARSAASEWSEAVESLGTSRKAVVAYLGMRIIDLHDEEIADEFFERMTDLDNGDPTDPFADFGKMIRKDERAEKRTEASVHSGRHDPDVQRVAHGCSPGPPLDDPGKRGLPGHC